VKNLSILGSVAALLACLSTTQAATLIDVHGKVLVNHGGHSKFVPAAVGEQLNPGDVVLARNGGTAEIVYSTECRVPVISGGVSTVNPQVCQFKASNQPDDTRNGVFGGNALPAIGAGVLFVGGVTAAVVLSDNKTRPASP